MPSFHAAGLCPEYSSLQSQTFNRPFSARSMSSLGLVKYGIHLFTNRNVRISAIHPIVNMSLTVSGIVAFAP